MIRYFPSVFPYAPSADTIPRVRWLLHGNLSTAVAEALVRDGDKAQSLETVDLAADAPVDEVFEAANSKQLDIVTNDPALAGAPFESESPK